MASGSVRPVRDYIARWPQCEVHHLILSGDEFIVFLDKALDVDWSTTNEYDGKDTDDDKKLRSEILVLAAVVECIPNDHQKADVRLNFKRMVGEGVARALEHQYESARRMLAQAQRYIEARNVEKARYWQLCTACILGTICALVGLVLWSFRRVPMTSWGEPAYFLVMAGIAGCVGASLSMIFRMGKSYPTGEAPKELHVLEAASRVLAGCFSGLLAAGAVQVGIILPFARVEQVPTNMVVLAFVSGASERLVPSIISRVESSSAGGRKT